MKKFVLILGLIISTVIYGQNDKSLFSRILMGDMLSAMKGFTTMFGGADAVAFDKDFINAKLLVTYTSSGLGVVINNRDVYIGSQDESFTYNGREVRKVTWLKDKTGTGQNVYLYLLPVKDFQVGGKIVYENKEFIVTDRDIRRMKQMILKRDVELSFMHPKTQEVLYKGIYGQDWVTAYLKDFPERDLGE